MSVNNGATRIAPGVLIVLNKMVAALGALVGELMLAAQREEDKINVVNVDAIREEVFDSLLEEREKLAEGCSGKLVEELRKGEFSTLGAGVSVSGREEPGFVRCWQGRGRSDWNVVVQVCPRQHQLILREAKSVLRASGVVVAPYLTALGCSLRRERQGVFDTLLAKGLTPRWRKGVQIEYSEAGLWKWYDFDPSG